MRKTDKARPISSGMRLAGQVDRFLGEHDEIRVENGWCCRPRSKRVRLPAKLDTDLCRLLGLLHGDGNLSGHRVLFTDECLEFHRRELHPLFKRVFGIQLHLFHDVARRSYYSHVKNRTLYGYLTEVLEVSAGAVRNGLVVPSCLEDADLECRSAYVGGLFDAEGWVSARQAEIGFSTTCESIFELAQEVIGEQGVDFSATVRRRRKNPEHEIHVYGKDDVERFQKRIAFFHPAKKSRLAHFLHH